MDRALETMTRDMTPSEKASYTQFWDNHVTEHTKDTINEFGKMFIFAKDVTCKIEYDENTIGQCAVCEDDVPIWEEGYVHGTEFYCEGCDEDNFFYCEACSIFYSRGDQAGYNLCVDCACKGGSLIPHDMCWVDSHPKLRDMEAWIQKWSNPNYTFDNEFEDYIGRPDTD